LDPVIDARPLFGGLFLRLDNLVMLTSLGEVDGGLKAAMPKAAMLKVADRGVSPPHLIKVLEQGKIPYRKVGRHRRIFSKDVAAFKETMRAERRAAMDELVSATEDAGGYDL
jgi:excisionase family DNA binding protein